LIIPANSVEVLSGKIPSDTLSQMARTAMTMLQSGDYRAFAETYGYALGFDRDSALALRDDLNQTLSEVNIDAAMFNHGHPIIEVQHFEANDLNIHSAVACKIATESGSGVLVEFIVSGKGLVRHFGLEQISAAV